MHRARTGNRGISLEWNIRVNDVKRRSGRVVIPSGESLVKGKRYRYAKQRDCPLLFSPRGNTNDDNDNDNDNDNENDNGNDNDSD